MNFKQTNWRFQKYIIIGMGIFCSWSAMSFSSHVSNSSTLYALTDELSSDNINPSDAYDPFMDYTVFERTEEERDDVRFFKKGRLLTLATTLGVKLFTGSMAQQVQPNINFGVQMGIFFNLSFCAQVYGLFSYHPFGFQHAKTADVQGFMEFYGFGADLKYYVDRDKIVKALAVLNPYVLVGFSAIQRNMSVELRDIGSLGYGFRAGGGIEVNLSNKFFIGLHGDFNFINFSEEWKEWELPNKTNSNETVQTGVYTYGDIINILFVAGMNY